MDDRMIESGIVAFLTMVAEILENQMEPEDLEVPEEFEGLSAVRSFEEAGILTSDRGCVLRFADGAEYQISIVRSR